MVQVHRLEWEAWKKIDVPTVRSAIVHTSIQQYYDCQQEEEAILDRWTNDKGPGELRESRRQATTALQSIALAVRHLNDRDPALFKTYQDQGVYDAVRDVMTRGISSPSHDNRVLSMDILAGQAKLFNNHGDPSRMEHVVSLISSAMKDGRKIKADGNPMLGENLNWKDPLMSHSKVEAEFRKNLISHIIPQLVIEHPEYAAPLTEVIEQAASGDCSYEVRAAAMDTLAALSIDRDDDYGVRVKGAFEHARQHDPNEEVRAAADNAIETVAFVAQSRAVKPVV